MTPHPSEETTVVAVYATRHDAEIAKSFLADNGIAAFVVADDVHVPMQLTEGARLLVMRSQARRALDALADVGMTPEGFTAGAEVLDDPDFWEPSDAEEAPADASEAHGHARKRRERAVVASTVAALVLVLLFFVPWRIERTDELMWAPFYRSPISYSTTYQEVGSAVVNYEEGEVAAGVLALQVFGIVAAGWLAFVVVGALTVKDVDE